MTYSMTGQVPETQPAGLRKGFLSGWAGPERSSKILFSSSEYHLNVVQHSGSLSHSAAPDNRVLPISKEMTYVTLDCSEGNDEG